MRKIVVGYDGSETAARAAVEAAALSEATGAELHFVNVVDDDRVRQGMITTEEQDRLTQQAAAMTQEFLSAQEGGPGGRPFAVNTITKIVSGPPAPLLVEYAADIDADLIVVGNRRVQGIERVLGSVAVAVLRHASCSVYVAHTAR